MNASSQYQIQVCRFVVKHDFHTTVVVKKKKKFKQQLRDNERNVWNEGGKDEKLIFEFVNIYTSTCVRLLLFRYYFIQ